MPVISPFMPSTILIISLNWTPTSRIASVPALTSFVPLCIDWTASSVDAWIDSILSRIFSADSWDAVASFLTSSDTTEKPLPCSPARAASMAALSASKFVWSAISAMASTICPICFELSPRRSTTSALAVTLFSILRIFSIATCIRFSPVCAALAVFSEVVATLVALSATIWISSETSPILFFAASMSFICWVISPPTSATVSATCTAVFADCVELAVNSSLDAANCSEVVNILFINPRRLWLIVLNALVNDPISSVPSTGISCIRKFPLAICLACSSSLSTGSVMALETLMQISVIMITQTTVIIANIILIRSSTPKTAS